MTRKVAITTDANGTGWFHHMPPEAPPKPTPIVMDDGSPRYRDWDRSAIVGGEGDGTDSAYEFDAASTIDGTVPPSGRPKVVLKFKGC
jgi:hypothetical protein